MGEERQFEFPDLNGIQITKEDIEEILNFNKCKSSFDLIEAD